MGTIWNTQTHVGEYPRKCKPAVEPDPEPDPTRLEPRTPKQRKAPKNGAFQEYAARDLNPEPTD